MLDVATCLIGFAILRRLPRRFGRYGGSEDHAWWTGRDLDPRPQRCQRCDHTKLIYPPKQWKRASRIPKIDRKPLSITFPPETNNNRSSSQRTRGTDYYFWKKSQLGIITVSKQKLTTHEKEHAPNIQEVVVANPSTSTTTSNSLSRSTCCWH